MPTREQYITYVHGTIGHKRRRGRENDVADNEWFYGHVVYGQDYSWCLVKECRDMDHFGILTLNGGKAAYVPNMPGIARRVGAKVWTRPKRGSAAYRPGNRIGFDFNKTNEAEHTGTFWKTRDSTSFWSIDGNTGTDEVAARIRYYSDVLFVIETLGLDGATDQGEDMPEYVSLSRKAAQQFTAGKAEHMVFDVENSDKGKAHADGSFPGVLSGGKNGTLFTAEVNVTGPAGTYTLIEVDPKKKYATHKSSYAHIPIGTPHTFVRVCDAGMHLYVQVMPEADGKVDADVFAVYNPR
jgi:hypothetical protein